MFFEEITLNNFATYQGQHIINLAPTSPEKPIILIGGKNGCGKTTLMDALQLVLFGTLARCSNRGKLTYAEFLKRSINRDTPPEEGTRIDLRFSCQVDGENQRFKISRTWNKKNRTVKENFFVYSLQDEEIKFDRVLSNNWNDYLEGLFPSNIAHLFFFDGEKIEQLADFENSAQLLQSAIFSLLGLNVVDQLSRDLSTLEVKKQKTIKGLSNDKEVQNIQQELANTNVRIEELTQEKAQLQNKFDTLEKNKKEIDTRYYQQGGELFDRRQELESNLEKVKESHNESEEQLRTLAAGAAPLLLVKDLLKSVSQQAQQETEAGKQKIMSESLTSRDKSLLLLIEELQLPQDAVKAVDRFLQEDRYGREEASQIDCYLHMNEEGVDSLSSLLKTELPALKTQMAIDLQKTEDETIRLESLERALAGVPEEEAISDLIAQRENLQKQLSQTLKQTELLQMEIDRSRREREQKESEIRKALFHFADDQQEQKDIYHLIEHSGRVRETLDQFRNQVIKKHIGQIERLVLDSFKKILSKTSLVHNLRINPENFQVELYGPNNVQLSTERLSAGERQLLATSLLWGICRAAGMPLPTVIDTPLGRLDSNHRAKLIQNYFPQASHQVLLLSTDEEITGKYFKDLSPYISHTYLLSHDDEFGGTKVTETYFS